MTIRRSPFYFREMSVVALYNLSFQHTGVPVFGGGGELRISTKRNPIFSHVQNSVHLLIKSCGDCLTQGCPTMIEGKMQTLLKRMCVFLPKEC